MSEDKRFMIMDNLPKGTHSHIWDKQKQHNQGIGDELWLGEVVAMLNEGVTLAEENEELKQGVNHWKKILNDYQQIVAETLREQYHWLKNEDKILNQDKTVALLEIESIATYLGVDLE